MLHIKCLFKRCVKEEETFIFPVVLNANPLLILEWMMADR